MMRRPLLPLLAGFALLLSLAACGGDSKPALPAGPAMPKGQQLMTQYCGTCHIAPSPSDLDQKTWKNHILVRMGAYMGIYNDNVQYYDSVPAKWLEPGVGGARVRAAGIYPAQPMLSRPDWEALRDYILNNAPGTTTAAPGMLPIARSMPGWTVEQLIPDPELQPLVTAVAIEPGASGNIYAAFFQQRFVQLGTDGRIRAAKDGLYGPVYIAPSARGLTVADIGSMKGSDHPKGSVALYDGMGQLRSGQARMRMDSLMRPVMCKWADLDQDGDEDAVIAEFGYHMGELAWHEAAGGSWTRHTLYGDDGTVAIHVADFTGDGLPDIMSLRANADERLDLYVNQGKGAFEVKPIQRFNPTYGCTALEVTDWDGDGKLDVLVANGDNGDYPPILKPNHGIRLYLNRGNAQFQEAHYWPLDGAYGLRVRDYDRDGDPDIAAVSFYPDYKARPEEAFVYLQNDGGNWKAMTFAEVGIGRWMVMDAGDVDGDGDEDIVLGAFDVKSDDCSEATYDAWLQGNVPLVLLRNELK